MKISHLKTNHVANPLGFAIEKPSFSWMVEDTGDTVQTAAQIIVSLDDGFQHVLPQHDCGGQADWDGEVQTEFEGLRA